MIKPLKFKSRGKNKRGVISLIVFFMLLFVVLIFGFIASVAVSIIDFTADQVIPIVDDLGVAGATNISRTANFVVTPVNILLQALPWLVGFSYVAALVFSVVFVIFMRDSPHPAFIGFYFMLLFLLIIGAIIMSNMYQNIYTQDNEIGTRLQEQTLLAYMILYSPFILTLIAVIAGIYLFAAPKETSGGFGV